MPGQSQPSNNGCSHYQYSGGATTNRGPRQRQRSSSPEIFWKGSSTKNLHDDRERMGSSFHDESVAYVTAPIKNRKSSVGSNIGLPNGSNGDTAVNNRYNNFHQIKSYLNWYLEIKNVSLREEFRFFLMTQKVGASRLTFMGCATAFFLMPTFAMILCQELRSDPNSHAYLIRIILAIAVIVVGLLGILSGWILYGKRQVQMNRQYPNQVQRTAGHISAAASMSSHHILNTVIASKPVITSIPQRFMAILLYVTFVISKQEYLDLLYPVIVDMNKNRLIAVVTPTSRNGIHHVHNYHSFSSTSSSSKPKASSSNNNSPWRKIGSKISSVLSILLHFTFPSAADAETSLGIATTTSENGSNHHSTNNKNSNHSSDIENNNHNKKSSNHTTSNSKSSRQTPASMDGSSFSHLPPSDQWLIERIHKAYTKFYLMINILYVYCIQFVFIALFLRRLYGLNCHMEHNRLTDFFSYGRCYPTHDDALLTWSVQPVGMFMLVHVLLIFIMMSEIPIAVIWGLMAFSLAIYAPTFLLKSAIATLPATSVWVILNLYAVADTHFSNVMIFLSNKRLVEALVAAERMEEVSRTNTMKHMVGNAALDMREPLSSFGSCINSIDHHLSTFQSTNKALIQRHEDLSHLFRHVKQSLTSGQSANALMSMQINQCSDFMKASKGLQLTARMDTLNLIDTMKHVMQVMHSSLKEDRLLKGSNKIDDNSDLRRNRRLTVDCVATPMPSYIGTYVITDKLWLVENLLILLKNAVKSLQKQFRSKDNVKAGRDALEGRITLKVSLVEKTSEGEIDDFDDKKRQRNQTKGNGGIDDATLPRPYQDTNGKRRKNSQRNALCRVHPVASDSDIQENQMKDVRPMVDDRDHVGGFSPVTPFSFSNAPTDNVDDLHSSSASSIASISASNVPLYLKFEVEDNGLGMTEDVMRTLFRTSKHYERLSEGRGLALYCLTKRLDALGGAYGVTNRSDNRRGCVFWFVIPYQRDDSVAELLKDVLHKDGRKEEEEASDDDGKQKSMRSIREPSKYSERTRHYSETHKDLSSRENNTKIDDNEDGKVIMLFETKRDNSSTLSLNEEEEEDQQNQNGTNTFRPEQYQLEDHDPEHDGVVVESLESLEDSMLSTTIESPNSPSAELTDSTSSSNGNKLSMLIVDDSVTVLETTKFAMRRFDAYSISTADSGHTAIKLVQQKLQRPSTLTGNRFDVIIMDIQMPGMNGLEAIRRIRRAYGQDIDVQSNSNPKKTIIFAVSAYADEGTIQAALQAGADDFLSKPLDVQVLNNIINHRLLR